MNYKIVNNINKIDRDRWSEFVYNHPNGNIFQTPEMYAVYQSTKNYEPVLVAAIDDNENIQGIMLAVIQKEYSGLLGNFTARSIIFGGPLIKDNNSEVLALILNKYNDIIKRKAIYSQFRNMWDWGELETVFLKNGFQYEDHLNILVNLSKSEEELWKDVSSKRKNGIRRAKKEGTIFSVKNTINDLNECYIILKSVYKRAKLPIPNISFFKNIFKNSNNLMGLKLFTAEYKNKIIGCMLALTYKNTIYDFYAGALPEYYSKYPNDLIPWEVFLWGKKKGYSIFDFGGAGKPNKPYGVRDYKKQFGGELKNYGRFEKVHKLALMEIGKVGFKILQKVKN